MNRVSPRFERLTYRLCRALRSICRISGKFLDTSPTTIFEDSVNASILRPHCFLYAPFDRLRAASGRCDSQQLPGDRDSSTVGNDAACGAGGYSLAMESDACPMEWR